MGEAEHHDQHAECEEPFELGSVADVAHTVGEVFQWRTTRCLSRLSRREPGGGYHREQCEGCADEVRATDADRLDPDEDRGDDRTEHPGRLDTRVAEKDRVCQRPSFDEVSGHGEPRRPEHGHATALHHGRGDQHPVRDGVRRHCDRDAERGETHGALGQHHDATFGKSVGNDSRGGNGDQAGNAETEYDPAQSLVVAGELVGQPTSRDLLSLTREEDKDASPPQPAIRRDAKSCESAGWRAGLCHWHWTVLRRDDAARIPGGPIPVNENAPLVAERSSFYETLKTLTSEEWDHPSLCSGWRNRDVATHVHLALTISLPRLLLGLAMNRGDFNRFMAAYVPEVGNRPAGEILDSWHAVASSANIPPTTKKVEIALDAFVHHHDIAVPIGKDVPSDPERLRWMADGMVAAQKPILSGPRVKGLQLIATDIDWHYGTGPEIHGPAAALILAGCGRSALNEQMEGDGLAELARRG